MAKSPFFEIVSFFAIADFSALITVMRPFQLVPKLLFLHIGQRPVSIRILHSLQARFILGSYFFAFFSFLTSFFLGSSLGFSSSVSHSILPSPGWRIVNPNLGLAMSL